jgi:hypothetical protein
MSFYVPPEYNFKGIVFVHIPKTGGSSIMLSMKSRFKTTLVDVGHAKISDPILPPYFSFAVFRDPYERAVSFYNEAYNLVRNRPDRKEDLKVAINKIDLLGELDKGFDYFVKNYFTVGLPHPDTPHILVSPHQSQLSFIIKNNRVAVNKLLDFSCLHEEWKYIEDYVESYLPLPYENVGNLKIDDITFTEETRKIIEHFYKDDIEFYKNWKK